MLNICNNIVPEDVVVDVVGAVVVGVVFFASMAVDFVVDAGVVGTTVEVVVVACVLVVSAVFKVHFYLMLIY